MEFFRINGGLRGEGGIREGNRGGLGLFKWDDIKTDAQKECYLGNSVKASTGRWQKHKNLHWFLQEKEVKGDVQLDELAEIKRREAQAMAEALGVKVDVDEDQAKVVQEEIKKEIHINQEKVVGIGYQGSKRRELEKQYKREYRQRDYDNRNDSRERKRGSRRDDSRERDRSRDRRERKRESKRTRDDRSRERDRSRPKERSRRHREGSRDRKEYSERKSRYSPLGDRKSYSRDYERRTDRSRDRHRSRYSGSRSR